MVGFERKTGVGIIYFLLFAVFVLLLIVLSSLVLDGLWIYFLVLFFCCFLCLWPLQGSQRSGKSLEYQEKDRKIKKSGKNLQNSWKFVWKSKTSVETQDILFWNKIHFYVKHFLHVHMLLKIYFFSVN